MTYLTVNYSIKDDVLLSVYINNYGIKLCMQKNVDKIMYSNSGRFFWQVQRKFSLGIDGIKSSTILVPWKLGIKHEGFTKQWVQVERGFISLALDYKFYRTKRKNKTALVYLKGSCISTDKPPTEFGTLPIWPKKKNKNLSSWSKLQTIIKFCILWYGFNIVVRQNCALYLTENLKLTLKIILQNTIKKNECVQTFKNQHNKFI